MGGQASQYRKAENHPGGGLGEPDIGQGPVGEITPGPEALAVLGRMSALDYREERAITNFVNSAVTYNLWDKIVDFWGLALNGTDFLTSFKGAETVSLFGTTIHQPGVGLEMLPDGYGLTARNLNLILPQVHSAGGAYVLNFFLEDTGDETNYWGALDGTNNAGFFWQGETTQDFIVSWGNGDTSLTPCFQRPENDTLISGDDGAGNNFVLFPDDFLREAAKVPVAMPAEQFAFNGYWQSPGQHIVGRHVLDCSWFFLLGQTREDLTNFREINNRFVFDLRVPGSNGL